MTTEKLKERLKESANNLRNIVEQLDNVSISSLSLHSNCSVEIRKFETIANQLDSIRDRIETREYARQILNNLPAATNSSTDMVNYHGTTMPFSTARMLGFINYLSMTWTICDSITNILAPLVCTESTYKNPKTSPQITNFIKESNFLSYHSTYFLKVNYGWAIGVSYVIRNHFVHDGALLNGDDFFEGKSSRDEFKISTQGWVQCEKVT